MGAFSGILQNSSLEPLERLEPLEPADLFERLDPRVISLQRINGALFTAILALGSFMGVIFSLLREDDGFGARWVVIPALWLATVVLFAWHSYRWPARA